MRTSKVYHVYDSHTAGMPTRVMLEGVPHLNGKSMMEKKKDLSSKHDRIRTALLQEPRGNSGVAALLVPPTDPRADYGVIFSDMRGYVDMCIHGTIGVVTTLFELGLVPAKKKEIVLDTPAGLVRARIDSLRRRSVTVSNVPSLYLREVELSGKVNASLAFGGNIYAYVDARDLGVSVKPGNLSKLLSIARGILSELSDVKVAHPSMPGISGVLGVSIYEDLGDHSRNIMVAANDLFDRSPCGTGTCGRMAVLNHEKRLGVGERFVNKSIIGSEFVGRIRSMVAIGGNKAIVPDITGTAYITGISDLVVSEGDRLGEGFRTY